MAQASLNATPAPHRAQRTDNACPGSRGCTIAAAAGSSARELVMVGDDQLQAQLAGRLRLGQAGDAAIDRDDQRRPALGQRPQRLVVQPVAFFEPIGHVVRHIGPEQPQADNEDRRAGHAVGVVVAIDDDLSLVADGRMNSVGRVSTRRAVRRDRAGPSACIEKRA